MNIWGGGGPIILGYPIFNTGTDKESKSFTYQFLPSCPYQYEMEAKLRKKKNKEEEKC
jgi:hypothetical protein